MIDPTHISAKPVFDLVAGRRAIIAFSCAFAFAAFSVLTISVLGSNGAQSSAGKATSTKPQNPASADISKKIKVKGVALRIQKADPRLDSDATDFITGQFNGTELSVILARPGKRIVSVDDVASKLITFTDDKKFDLAKATSDEWNMDAGFTSQIAKDGSACLIEFSAPRSPSPKANKIHVKAKIVLRCGTQPKTVEQTIPLRAGSRFNRKPFAFRVSEIKKAESVKGGIEVSFESRENLDRISKIVFIGSNGKPIASQSGGNGYSSGDGPPTYYQSYVLNSQPKQVKMRVTFYSQMESIPVPLDLKYDVGL